MLSRLKSIEALSVIERASLAFTLASLLFFLLSSVLLLSFLTSERESSMESRTAEEIIAEAASIQLSLIRVETGYRGYLLSRNEDFLAPLSGQREATFKSLDRIKAKMSLSLENSSYVITQPLDEPVDLSDWSNVSLVSELEAVARSKFEFAFKILDLDRRGGYETAVELVRSGEGKRQMDRAREITSQLITNQSRILAKSKKLNDKAIGWTRIISTISALLAIGLLVVAITLASHLVRRKSAMALQEERMRQAEKALEMSDRQFQTLTAALPQIIWTATSEGEVNFINRSIGGEFGRQPEEMNWMKLIHPSEQIAFEMDWANAVKTGASLDKEIRIAAAGTNSYRWFVVNAEPLKSGPSLTGEMQNSGVLKWFGTLTDIDSQRKLVEERDRLLASERTARSSAELAVRLKDEFVATLSHELRTPLNAMMGWIQICQRRKGDSATWENALDVLERNARLQSKLISDLLDSHRMMTGKVDYDHRPVEITKLLEKIVADLSPSARNKNLTITTDLSSEMELMVLGDQQRLQQVFTNLLSNALKFTDSGGSIKVSTGPSAEGVGITFADTGTGMTEEFLKVAFDKYRQANATTSRSVGGLGLGLTIAKGIVEAHGGSITATSPGLGKGSAFTVTLPFFDSTVLEPLEKKDDATEQLSVINAGKMARELLQTRSIVAIDDQIDARNLIKELMQDIGIAVEVAESGELGLALCRKIKPAAIFCDIGMPNLDGYVVAKEIRNDTRLKDVVLIALTAHARPDDIERTLAAGFDAHISKPIDFETLIGSLALHLRRKVGSNGNILATG